MGSTVLYTNFLPGTGFVPELRRLAGAGARDADFKAICLRVPVSSAVGRRPLAVPRASVLSCKFISLYDCVMLTRRTA